MDKTLYLRKALELACTHLSELGQCTHYSGYTCDKDFPKECPKCLKNHYMQLVKVKK